MADMGLDKLRCEVCNRDWYFINKTKRIVVLKVKVDNYFFTFEQDDKTISIPKNKVDELIEILQDLKEEV